MLQHDVSTGQDTSKGEVEKHHHQLNIFLKLNLTSKDFESFYFFVSVKCIADKFEMSVTYFFISVIINIFQCCIYDESIFWRRDELIDGLGCSN